MLIVTDTVMAHQAVYHPVSGTEKPPMLTWWFHPITGGPSQFDTNGPTWKHLHQLFSPAFSNSNISAAVPMLIANVEIFTARLRAKAAEGNMFKLEHLMLDLITDIIGDVNLNMRLNTQTSPHPLAEAMKGQLRLKFTSHKPEYVFAPIDPILLFRTWYGGRKLDGHIKAQILTRFRELLRRKFDHDTKAESFTSVLDTALEDWLTQPRNAGRKELDAELLRVLIQNMRMFFFAGYDSSAAAFVYCLHNIHTHPDILARIRAEHDAVLGPDLAATPGKIAADPALLNALPYTNACIKESMRLFPPAGAIRQGCEDLVMTDAEGTAYPTEGVAVTILHWAVGRNPRYWVRPDDFLPERWLVAEGDELYPPKGGWRVFEYGPRLCVGQQLVMTEARAILACLVREFDVKDCYKELDIAQGKGDMDLSGVGGQRVFMVETGAAHPVDSYPCRVKLSGHGVAKTS